MAGARFWRQRRDPQLQHPERATNMLAPRAIFLLIAWTMNLGCLAAPVSLPDSASKDEWTQPSQPSGRRVEASNEHAREVIHKWTDEEIASAIPRNMKVDDEPTRRSRKLLQTEVIDDEWDSNWGGVLQNAVTISLCDCIAASAFRFPQPLSTTQLLSHRLHTSAPYI